MVGLWMVYGWFMDKWCGIFPCFSSTLDHSKKSWQYFFIAQISWLNSHMLRMKMAIYLGKKASWLSWLSSDPGGGSSDPRGSTGGHRIVQHAVEGLCTTQRSHQSPPGQVVARSSESWPGPSWHSEQPGTARKWVFLVNFKTLWDWDYIWYCTMMYYVIYWLTSWRGFSGIQSLWWVDNGAGLSISASSWLEDRHQEPPCRASKAQSPSMAKAKRYYLQHHSRTGSQLDVAWLALMN